MKEPHWFGKNHSFSMAKTLVTCLLVCLTTAPVFAQDEIASFYPKQEVRIANLPSLAAASPDASAVLAATLETIIGDKTVCCGKGSALENVLLSSPPSLKDLSGKLPGKHVLNDGRHVTVSAEYVPQSSISSDLIISTLQDRHTPLIEWKSHVYVLYGAIFDKTIYSSGRRQFAIRKLLLRDPRFSDQRSDIEFNRETDDWGKIQGFLTLTVAQQ